MKILITGGAGFIGSHLADHLLVEGHEVEVIDDLSTGSMGNIAHLRGRSGFSCVINTIFNEEVLAECIERCEVIIHLAAAVGVRLIVEQPVHTIETNIKGTEIVLALAAKGKKAVLIASTSEVYGKSEKILFSEADDLIVGPTSHVRGCYAASKIVDEFLALAYHREQGLPVIIVRLFNTIGPRQTGQYGMVVPRFIKQALEGSPITVYGDGTQRRSFTWVGDAVKVLAHLSANPAAWGQVFNIGHTDDISIQELAVQIKGLTRSSSEITLVPYDQAFEYGFEDTQRRLPDLTKIKKLLDYRPTMPLAQMLEEIIQFHRRAPTSIHPSFQI